MAALTAVAGADRIDPLTSNDIRMRKTTLPFTDAPSRLCILRLSALGDVTHMVPVVRSIQAEWPETQLTWCIGTVEQGLVGDIEGVEFIPFRKDRGWRGYGALRDALQGRRFDALVHAQVSMRANLASLAIRADRRLGYDRDRAKDLHGLFVNARIPRAPGQHVLDSFFSFAETLGVTRRELRWDIPIPDEDRAFAAKHIPDGEPVLIISPCGSHRWRNWLPERYAAVADYAIAEYGYRVLLTGGPSAVEREMGEAILGHMRHVAVNLIGATSLKQLLALLERGALLISPDSGPMHMATTVGTPVIGLHAASNPQRSGPYLSREWCVDRYDAAARMYLGRPAAELKWGTRILREDVMHLVETADVIERLDALTVRLRGPADRPTHRTPEPGS